MLIHIILNLLFSSHEISTYTYYFPIIFLASKFRVLYDKPSSFSRNLVKYSYSNNLLYLLIGIVYAKNIVKIKETRPNRVDLNFYRRYFL